MKDRALIVFMCVLTGCVWAGILHVVIIPIWEVNSNISRCFDDYAPDYIHDDAARAAACDLAVNLSRNVENAGIRHVSAQDLPPNVHVIYRTVYGVSA